jgi:hypothetical protein
MHLVEVLVEEHCDLEEWPRGETRDAHAAVALQAEERAQTFLAPTRRAQLDQKVGDVGAEVPEAVPSSRRNDDLFARADSAAAETNPEAKLARHALEALPLARVNMRWDEATGADEELGGDPAFRPVAEDDALPRNGIRDRVYAWVEHLI